MLRTLPLSVLSLLLCCDAVPAADPYAVKVGTTAAPMEAAASVRALLGADSLQLTDADGAIAVEVWPRKELPARATAAQLKNGLTYREIPETTLLAVVRLARPWTDYRKQKLPAGVYTLRLAYQPVSDDHVGTAPYTEFALLCPAAEDDKPDLMEPKALHELSARSTGKHPAVLLLFPDREAGAPKLINKGDGHWMLHYRQEVSVDGAKGGLGVGLTLLGATSAGTPP